MESRHDFRRSAAGPPKMATNRTSTARANGAGRARARVGSPKTAVTRVEQCEAESNGTDQRQVFLPAAGLVAHGSGMFEGVSALGRSEWAQMLPSSGVASAAPERRKGEPARVGNMRGSGRAFFAARCSAPSGKARMKRRGRERVVAHALECELGEPRGTCPRSSPLGVTSWCGNRSSRSPCRSPDCTALRRARSLRRERPSPS